MGCFWSRLDLDPSDTEVQRPYGGNATTVRQSIEADWNDLRQRHLKSLEQQRESRTTSVVRQQAETEAKYGQYKCICGRFWDSRLCWPDRYQKCKKCNRPVFPHTYRELEPSDHKTGEEVLPEHDQELCQMCEQLGYSCLVFKRNKKQKRFR